jgi:hypothetical protein
MCTISVLAVFCTLPPFAGVGVISARGSLSLYGTCPGEQPSSGDLTSPPGDPRPGVHSMVHCSDCKPTSVQKGAGTCVSVTAIPMQPTSTLFILCQIASQTKTAPLGPTVTNSICTFVVPKPVTNYTMPSIPPPHSRTRCHWTNKIFNRHHTSGIHSPNQIPSGTTHCA